MKSLLQRLIFGLPKYIRFFPIYLWEMTLSNFRVAIDALRPEPRFVPGFVRLPLRGYNALQWWAAASLISMTPGTLSVDLEEDTQCLLVHSLYLQDPDQTVKELKLLIHRALGTPNTTQT